VEKVAHRSRDRDTRGDRGSAAVEFALVLPLLLLLVIGMLDFGVTYNHWLTVTTVAREGARLAAVGPCSVADVKAVAANCGLDSGQVQVTKLTSTTSSSRGKYWTVTVLVTRPAKNEVRGVYEHTISESEMTLSPFWPDSALQKYSLID
jgi:Flp pilus assembly protein TadG